MATTPLTVKVQVNAAHLRRVMRESMRASGLTPAPAHRADVRINSSSTPSEYRGKHRARGAA